MPFTGEKIIYYPSCESTNTTAMELLSIQKVCEGTIVITDEQTKGRGQRGNKWLADPYQNLTFSIIFYPTWLSIQNTFFLYMVSALGVYEALSPYLQKGLSIKWPNDIYFMDQKLGGILVENMVQKDRIRGSVIGIGLNVNQINFPGLPRAVSLAAIEQRTFSLSELLVALSNGVGKEYERLHQNRLLALKQDYLKYLYGLDVVKTFQDGEGIFEGIIQDIDASGRLVIECLERGVKHYMTKEVAYVL